MSGEHSLLIVASSSAAAQKRAAPTKKASRKKRVDTEKLDLLIDSMNRLEQCEKQLCEVIENTKKLVAVPPENGSIEHIATVKILLLHEELAAATDVYAQWRRIKMM